MSGYLLTCPECPHTAPLEDFVVSLALECRCPKCGCAFQFEFEADEDEDEDWEESP